MSATTIATLIAALLEAGIQAAPVLQALLTTRQQLTADNATRPDATDAEMQALDAGIAQLQAQIDAA